MLSTAFLWLKENVHLGEALALVGIAITIDQIRRVGKIVNRVNEALGNASAQSSIYNVLAVAPRISGIDHQLDLAARHNDLEAFTQSLKSYKELAAELH